MTLFYYFYSDFPIILFFYSAFPLHVLQSKQFQGHYFIVSIVLSHFMFFRANSFNDIILLFLQCFPTSCSSEQTVSMTLFYCFYSAFPLHVLQIKQFQGHYFIISIVLSHFMFFRANSFNDIILLFLQCFPTSSDQAFQGHYFIVSIVLSHFMCSFTSSRTLFYSFYSAHQ